MFKTSIKLKKKMSYYMSPESVAIQLENLVRILRDPKEHGIDVTKYVKEILVDLLPILTLLD